ncbi:HAD family hydrolase [Natrarchaeobaculum sulfurireducens]|uniref:HAD superfamily hydrolase n=1 Tax=Natrarchaeobaculum sulfurireducens TaxID=2044521 RepID=A0A346PSK0_9EURY|nr:HAD-IA family hydrolase [Natrarchaeobaculum sulfurireducens]AXR82495.1 HAD superfamily hydrolase [Natrarchaeobaculum sulfurireducens]
MGTAYDAVLFDNDGVLTTPTDRTVLVDAMREAFRDVGISEPTDDHVQTLVRPTVSSLRQIATDHGLEPERLWRERERAAIDAQLEQLKSGQKRPYPDASALAAIETPTGIVSNNQHETIENILEYTDVGGFDVWYGREPTLRGIERKKPRPYYLEQAIAELDASKPLYVGDSQVDVEAANALGIDAAFVRRDHRLDYALSNDPTYEIESLEAVPELL